MEEIRPQSISKIGEIDKALNGVGIAVDLLESFVDNLYDVPSKPPGICTELGKPERSFINIYSDLATRLRAKEERIRDLVDRLKDLLH